MQWSGQSSGSNLWQSTAAFRWLTAFLRDCWSAFQIALLMLVCIPVLAILWTLGGLVLALLLTVRAAHRLLWRAVH